MKGFSLVEILVALLIMVSVGIVVVSIFFLSLQGTSRSAASTEVRENGEFVIQRVTNMVRNSQDFVGVINDNLATYTRNCYQVADAQGVSSEEVKYNAVKVKSFDNGQTEFTCPVDETEGISSNSASLINSDEVIVKENSCAFYCVQLAPGDIPAIVLEFTLRSKKEPSVESFYRTTVSPRNFNR